MTDPSIGSMSQSTAQSQRGLVLLSLVFVGVNALLFGISVPTASFLEADALTYHRMALQLFDTGSLHENQRQPLYPILIAGTFLVSGSTDLVLLVGVQLVFLYLTGIIVWLVAGNWLSHNAAMTVFGLVILNPNAIANAHLPLADTLHALVFMLAVWALLSWGTGGRYWFALACGALLGLASLTRPETKFLLYTLPVAIVLVRLVAGRPGALKVGIPLGIASLEVAFIVTMPWMLHNQAAGHGFGIAGGPKASENIRGHFALVEEARTGTPQQAAIRHLTAEEPDLLLAAGLENAANDEVRSFLFRHYTGRILDTELVILIKLYSKAWVAQFASGGAQTLNHLLDIPYTRTDKFMNQPGSAGVFIDSLRTQPLAGTLVTLLCVGFAITARLLGLFGLLAMLMRRHWSLLLVITAVLAFKGTVHLFYGIARYRLPVEPILMILAVYGWEGIRAQLPGRR